MGNAIALLASPPGYATAENDVDTIGVQKQQHNMQSNI